MFGAGDETASAGGGIIDERIARQRWPGESAIGKRMRVPARGDAGKASPWMEIVGVVGHVKHDGLDVDTRAQVYWNYRQRAQDRMSLVARTAADPARRSRRSVERIREIDPEQPVYDVRTMDEVCRDRSASDG